LAKRRGRWRWGIQNPQHCYIAAGVIARNLRLKASLPERKSLVKKKSALERHSTANSYILFLCKFDDVAITGVFEGQLDSFNKYKKTEVAL
jgi:hypothetical protein